MKTFTEETNIFDPGNLGKIGKIYAFLSVDADGNERILRTNSIPFLVCYTTAARDLFREKIFELDAIHLEDKIAHIKCVEFGSRLSEEIIR